MPGGAPNYYEVLGVPTTATLEEIKKRYRQLARQHHPDVNPGDPNAARRFTEIAEAYRVLSDANSRGAYDYDLAHARELAEAAERRRAAAASRSAGAAGASSHAASQPASPSPAAAAATAGSESARLVAQAKAAFERSRLVEARSLAEQSLRLNRRNAEAFEILGDIFRLQNRVEEAMNMYSMALQINPRRTVVMERLERMSRASAARATASGGVGGGGGGAFRSGGMRTPPPPRGDAYRPGPPRGNAAPGPPAGGYTASPPGAGYTPPAAPAASAYGGGRQHEESARRAVLGRMLTGVIGYGLTLLLALALSFHGTPPPPEIGATSWPLLRQISTWTPAVWGVLIGCGFLLGGTMTSTLAIRRIEDELMLPASGRAARFLPVGAILIVLSIVNFYAAALLYLLIQFFQEAITPSMLRVFGAVVLVVVLIGIAYSPGFGQILLFGGNVVFLSFLVGWVLGDFFRPYGH